MTVTTKKLTLYDIETELLELLELRDDVAAEVRVTEADQQEQGEQLRAIDQQIAEYVKRECVKADNVAGFLRECKTRATALKAEEDRIRLKRKAWEDREQRVKDRIAEVLAMTVDPQAIAEAGQNSVLKRVNGRTNELKLCKSPASVEVTDMSLLPAEFQTITVTMPLSIYAYASLMGLPPAPGVDESEPQPNKRAIGAVLKQGEPVPGARLNNSGVHVRIT